MKRRRRIEITRYSRRVTFIQGESAASDTFAERQAVDLIAEIMDGIPMPERADCAGSDSGAAVGRQQPRRRPFSRLGDLFRLRKRT